MTDTLERTRGYLIVRPALDDGGEDVYLADWDVDWQPEGWESPLPTGYAQFTANPDDAHVFASFEEAIGVWRQQSTRTPLRSDGRPNRPLTAYTIEVRPV